MNDSWEAYNPQWLVDLAKEQIPDKPEIISALSKCLNAKVRSKAYIYFVNSKNPKQANSEWQIEDNIVLEDVQHGNIILDVLKGNRIGRVEFCKYLD